MSQQYSPFKELIESARSAVAAKLQVANDLMNANDDPRLFADYLRAREELAAKVERQISILERMSAFFEEATV